MFSRQYLDGQDMEFALGGNEMMDRAMKVSERGYIRLCAA